MEELAELLKAVMWPLFAFYALWKLQPEIKKFFDELPKRKITVGATGVTLGAQEQPAPTGGALLESQAAGAAQGLSLYQEHDSKVYRDRIAAIENDARLKSEKVCENRERRLIREVATWQILYAFENVLTMIFGSQVEALRLLNAEKGPVDVTALQPLFDRARSKSPEVYSGEFSFDVWIGFLVVAGLAERPPGAQKLVISSGGQEFLRYLDAQGRRPTLAHV